MDRSKKRATPFQVRGGLWSSRRTYEKQNNMWQFQGPPEAMEAENSIHEHMRQLLHSSNHLLPATRYAKDGQMKDAVWPSGMFSGFPMFCPFSPTVATLSLLFVQPRLSLSALPPTNCARGGSPTPPPIIRVASGPRSGTFVWEPATRRTPSSNFNPGARKAKQLL